MIVGTLARRYARGVFAAAHHSNALDPVGADLRALVDLVEARREFRYFLLTPRVRKGRKQDALRAMFASQIHRVTLQFLFVLLEKRRQGLLRHISESYQALLDEHHQRVEVGVTSSQPLEASAQAALVALLGRLTGKQVRLQPRVDPALLGGLVVEVGTTVYDGSLRTQLARLEKQLLAA